MDPLDLQVLQVRLASVVRRVIQARLDQMEQWEQQDQQVL